jgi:hypothetical protein
MRKRRTVGPLPLALRDPRHGGDIVTGPINPMKRHPLALLLVMMLPVSNALLGCPGPDARGTRCSACPIITRRAQISGPCTLQELAQEALSFEIPHLTVVQDKRSR